MSTPALASRRPALLLALLLSACVVALSLQVRRSASEHTVAEGWLLDATAFGVRLVTAGRSGFSSVKEWGASRVRLADENRALRQRVTALEGELLTLRDAERDRLRLMELFGAHPAPPHGTRPARLIELSTSGPFHSAVLDRGSAAGIAVGGPVVNAKGLLGRVVAVGASTARVQLISDRLASAGVLLPRTAREAVARGDGSGRVVLQYVPTIADVVEGDAVVTAGTDGVYPRDLAVGRLAAPRRGGHSLFLDLTVEVAADPHLASVVFVFPPLLPPDARPPEKAGAAR